MLSPVFPGDSYDTQPGAAGFWASRFPSLVFFFTTLGIVHHDWKLAVKGQYDNAAWCQGSLNTLRALERCGVQLHISGMSRMDAVEGPCVFIGNHMSTLETFILPVLVEPRKHVTFVVKDSLLKLPYFGPVLQSRAPIALKRVNPREDLVTVLEEGTKRLESGTSIIVFPQSTRSSTLDMTRFNSIGVKLARRAGVPVIPLALRTDAWGVGRLIKDFGPVNPALPVRIAFGEPLRIAGNGKAEHAEVCGFIANKLELWGLPPRVHSPSSVTLPESGQDV